MAASVLPVAPQTASGLRHADLSLPILLHFSLQASQRVSNNINTKRNQCQIHIRAPPGRVPSPIMATIIKPPSAARFQPKPGIRRAPRATPPPQRSPSVGGSSTSSRNETPHCRFCLSRNLVTDDGKLVCRDCGVVLQETVNYRAEVEFDELASGQAAQRGQHVGANQTHQRVFTNRTGQAGKSNPGFEATKAEDRAKREAQYWFGFYKTNLGIDDAETNKATHYFTNAYRQNFYRGRTMHTVALVCLYLAVRCCKRKVYPLMLIDFAEIHNFNVFNLGKITKDLQSLLHVRPKEHEWHKLENEKRRADQTPEGIAALSEQQRRIQIRLEDQLSMVGAEPLIAKFCAKLDFGEDTNKVASDAVKVAKSMNRDWMTDGRRPAGVAGAAIIIAARMNNYRRTLREVVLVAKVTETTVGKRIEEFKETQSSQVSVQEFRQGDFDAAGHDPPSYYRAQPEWQAKQASKKRKRKQKKSKTADGGDEGDAAHVSDVETETEGETETEAEMDLEGHRPVKQPRYDADGFAVPELPVKSFQTAQHSSSPDVGTFEQVDSTDHIRDVPRRKVGRPPGAKNWKPPPPSDAELEDEASLTADIDKTLAQNASLDPTGTIRQDQSYQEALRHGTPTPDPGPGVLDIYEAPNETNTPIGAPVNTNIGNQGHVSLSPTLRPDEFEDDDDVANCTLNESERVIKETIWVTENADWLRHEHLKRIKKELRDREIREKNLDLDDLEKSKGGRGKRRKDGMRVSGRAGDVSYIEDMRQRNQQLKEDKGEQDGEQAAREGSQASATDDEDARHRREVSMTAIASVKTMLKQRGTFSRRVDYDKLAEAYMLPGTENSSDTQSRSQSRSESRDVDDDHFFKPITSRGVKNAAKRRARARPTGSLGRIGSASTLVDSKSAVSGSRSRSNGGKDDNDDDAEFDEDEPGTPEATSRSPTVKRGPSQAQLPTPEATQAHRSVSLRSPPSNRPSTLSGYPPSHTGTAGHDDLDDEVEDAESPLSSTHTPLGMQTGSGGRGTPTQQGANIRKPIEIEDNGEDEADDDDDDEDDYYVGGDDAPDLDPDEYLNAGGLGDEEEVVDDDD